MYSLGPENAIMLLSVLKLWCVALQFYLPSILLWHLKEENAVVYCSFIYMFFCLVCFVFWTNAVKLKASSGCSLSLCVVNTVNKSYIGSLITCSLSLNITKYVPPLLHLQVMSSHYCTVKLHWLLVAMTVLLDTNYNTDCWAKFPQTKM